MRPRDYLLSREDRLGKGRKYGDRSGKRPKGKENNRGSGLEIYIQRVQRRVKNHCEKLIGDKTPLPT